MGGSGLGLSGGGDSERLAGGLLPQLGWLGQLGAGLAVGRGCGLFCWLVPPQNGAWGLVGGQQPRREAMDGWPVSSALTGIGVMIRGRAGWGEGP